MNIQILCTLGPRSLDPHVIAALDAQEVDLFRINLSHTSIDEVERLIAFIRRHSSTAICLDTEGPQVRSGLMENDVRLERGTRIVLTAEDVAGSSRRCTLRPPSIIGALDIGSIVEIDFDGAAVRVVATKGNDVIGEVVEGGRVRSNKAVSVHPQPTLPSLSDKDVAAVAIGVRHEITHYALSFASTAKDVQLLRELAGDGAHIIAKIESRAGIRNMDEIIQAADSILIDRGDLSREVPIEHVPYCQKAIVRRANRWCKPAYVATNLLESMVTSRTPTVAEANDIANTLLDGVHGLVLAAETAVGMDPVGAVAMIRRAREAFERATLHEVLAVTDGAVDAAARRSAASGRPPHRRR